MGVAESALEEIFRERSEYLINIDEIMLETYGEFSGKTINISSEIPDVVKGIDIVDKIKVADLLFGSKEYLTLLQLTRPEEKSKRKFQPEALKKKLIDDNIEEIGSFE